MENILVWGGSMKIAVFLIDNHSHYTWKIIKFKIEIHII